MKREGVPTESDFDVVFHPVEILDSCGEEGVCLFGVGHFRTPSTRQLDSLGGVFFDELLLLPSEE